MISEQLPIIPTVVDEGGNVPGLADESVAGTRLVLRQGCTTVDSTHDVEDKEEVIIPTGGTELAFTEIQTCFVHDTILTKDD